MKHNTTVLKILEINRCGKPFAYHLLLVLAYFFGPLDYHFLVRFENTASCGCSTTCWLTLRLVRTCVAALGRAACAMLFCEVFVVGARRQHYINNSRSWVCCCEWSGRSRCKHKRVRNLVRVRRIKNELKTPQKNGRIKRKMTELELKQDHNVWKIVINSK